MERIVPPAAVNPVVSARASDQKIGWIALFFAVDSRNLLFTPGKNPGS